MPKLKQVAIVGYCARCKEKRPVSNGPEGEEPEVVQMSNGRFRLAGWCKECDAKMSVFLSDKKEPDASLIAAFEEAQPTTPVKVVKARTSSVRRKSNGKGKTSGKATRSRKARKPRSRR